AEHLTREFQQVLYIRVLQSTLGLSQSAIRAIPLLLKLCFQLLDDRHCSPPRHKASLTELCPCLPHVDTRRKERRVHWRYAERRILQLLRGRRCRQPAASHQNTTRQKVPALQLPYSSHVNISIPLGQPLLKSNRSLAGSA